MVSYSGKFGRLVKMFWYNISNSGKILLVSAAGN